MSLAKDLFSLGEANLRLQGGAFQSAHPNEHQIALQNALDDVLGGEPIWTPTQHDWDLLEEQERLRQASRRKNGTPWEF